MNANNEMEDDDIETVEYVKPRAKGLRALLPEEKTPVERAKEAYHRYAPTATTRAKEAYRRYAPRVKKAAKKAFTAARQYSQERKRRHPEQAERRQPSLGDLLRSRGARGPGQLTGTLGSQVGMFGKDKKRGIHL